MELEFRKKSRRDKTMRSKSFETQEVRQIGRRKAGVKRLSHLMNRNNRCLPDLRKGMQRPGKIKNVYEKIHDRARRVLQYGIGDFVWASGSGQEEDCGATRNSAGQKGEQKKE